MSIAKPTSDTISPAAAPKKSGRVKRWLCHRFVRCLTAAHSTLLSMACRMGPKPRRPKNGCDILVTGRFDSNNWILSHLGPLSRSTGCRKLRMVSTNPVPPLPKVEGLYPPKWLPRLVGTTPARLLTFIWHAFRLRPDIVGGFHMLINGMVSTLVGRCVGARTMYFCVGGPVEVLDGGVWGEGNYFSKMETPDPAVEKRLLQTVAACDLVITMGTRAVQFFRDRGIETGFHVVSGGIDSSRFRPPGSVDGQPVDVVFTGRLVPIKRIDILLEAVGRIVQRVGDLKVALVGSGDLREELEAQAGQLGIEKNVEFLGHQEDVESWLRRSKLFVLTSDSEGLSLALMEAMMSGLPAVVSDVGDLGDLVRDGVNGYLVPRRCPDAFADRIADILVAPGKLAQFSRAAHASAMEHDVPVVIRQWDRILESLGR